MAQRSILFLAVCVSALALPFGLWYQFGPESAAPHPAAMRQYRLSQLSDADLREIVEKARKDRDERVERIRAAAKKADEREREEYAARVKTRAQCDSDPVFKLRNEDLCDPGPIGFITLGPVVPDVPEPSVDAFVEGYIMGPCRGAATVREARSIGCLPPK